MTKKVGIILINYKDYAEKFLSACLNSWRAQSYPVADQQLYIVDNASSNKSVAYLQAICPEAVILSRDDGNYAAANNLGFNRAINDGCKYVVTVNMDTEMAVDWLRELVRALDENPLAGIAQSKIMLFPRNEEEQEKPRINSLGNIIHFLGFGFTNGYGEADREISGYPEITGYASGCSFIIRSELFKKIGGYNEEFYMYHDDMELSLKVRLSGQRIILAPLSIIFHKYEFSRSVGMLYYMERNRYLVLLTFFPTAYLFLFSLPVFFMDCGMFFYSLINGWFKTELKIYIYFCSLKNYTKIQQEKKKIKKIRVIPFSVIARNFSGRIDFQEIASPILKYFVNPLFNLYWRLVKRII